MRLGAVAEGLREGLPGLRWVPAENYHITMRYFGRVKPRRLAAIKELAAQVAAGAAATGAVLNRVGWFGRRPRVLWAGAATLPGRLAALAEALDTALPKPGPHPFSPHVTLARFPARAEPDAKGAWNRRLPALADDPTQPWAEVGAARCRFGAMALFASLPTAGGVRYEELARWPLGAG